LPALGAAPLDDPGEGQHAEIAREAWAEGHWIPLHLAGVRYVDKPPLPYVLAAAAYQIWGVGEWSARLPSVLGAAVAAAATAWLGARLLGPAAGAVAGLAVLSSPLFAAFARYVRPEALFCAAIQLGFLGLLLGRRAGEPERAGGDRRWQIAGALALGLATLAKNPLGTAGPLAAIALALALTGQLRPMRAWLSPPAVAALALIPLAWYGVEAASSPGSIGYTLVDQGLRGAMGARHFPDEDVPLGSGEFLAVALLGAFPWSLAAAGAIAALVRRRAWRDPAEAPWIALALWAVGVVAVFAVVPFKLPHYGLPAYGAIALLAARWWWERPPASRAAAALHLVLFAALAAGLAWVALGDGQAFLASVVGTADVTARKDTAAGALPAWADLEPLVGRTAAIFAVGAAGLAAAVVRRAPRLALAAVTATALACVPAVSAGLAVVATWRSVAPLAAELTPWPGATRVVHEGPLEYSAALELYSGRRPVILDGTRSVLGFGATFPDARDRFWTRERLARELADGRPVLLITPRGPRGVLGALPAGCRAAPVEARGVRWLAVLRC